ncbi:hypothetical protein, partial [Ornithinimicrobium cerasi]|uniref:hypothetical protein n=1 Tax=Ornithinimicrobium cerasi TaxID=2248773 RepID=UPI001F3994D5
HQVRARLRELLVQEDLRVDTGRSGHRDAPFESAVEGSLEGSRGDRAYISRTRSPPWSSYTTLMDSTFSGRGGFAG